MNAFVASIARGGVHADPEYRVAVVGYHGEHVEPPVGDEKTILRHRKTQAAADRLPAFLFGGDLAQGADLEHVLFRRSSCRFRRKGA